MTYLQTITAKMHWVLTMQQVKHLRFIITLGLQSNLEKEAFPLFSFSRWGIRAQREGVSGKSQSWRRVQWYWDLGWHICWDHSAYHPSGTFLRMTRGAVVHQGNSQSPGPFMQTETQALNSVCVCVCVCVCVYLMHLFLINQPGQVIKDESSRHLLLG